MSDLRKAAEEMITWAKWADTINVGQPPVTFRKAFDNLIEALAQPEQEDSECKEDDGCPTEGAVLKRFWREHQKPEQEPIAWCWRHIKPVASVWHLEKNEPFMTNSDTIEVKFLHPHPMQPLRRLSAEDVEKLRRKLCNTKDACSPYIPSVTAEIFANIIMDGVENLNNEQANG